MRTATVISLGLLVLQNLPAATGTLRPAGEKPERATALPFFQAVPFAKGELAAAPHFAVRLDGKEIPAAARPVVFWPDGSVRWLGVDGLWPADAPVSPAAVTFEDKTPEVRPASLTLRENEARDALILSGAEGETLATLSPAASLLPINLPKEPQPNDSDYGDREGQYSWAQPLDKLSKEPKVEALTPRILKSTTEEDTPVYAVRVFQGDFGANGPGRHLEWQFRAKIFRDAPILQTEMTWIVRWPVDKYALASALWKITAPEPWKSFQLPDGSASGEVFGVHSEPDGSSVLLDGGQTSAPMEEPSVSRNGLLATGEHTSLGLGIPNFTRLGPNRLMGRGNTVEIAMWDGASGLALDLRRSSMDLDFGVGAGDISTDGKGFSQTLRATLAFFPDAKESAEVAENAMQREHLWLANSADLERTAALGPFRRDALGPNIRFVEGLKANMLFLVRSRDRWKWNGLANFGDYRTNFAVGKNPQRGLTPLRWALSGRYGWRNNAGDIGWGILLAGLFLDNREIALAGVDHALHTSEVDQVHGSLFAPEKGNEGGMHRRNRDHWSGAPQAQYSPSSGLYLTQWLTGDTRLREDLAGLRAFASKDGGKISPLPAQAWILRYMETRDPADLQTAAGLLATASDFWNKNAEGTPLTGPAKLFAKHSIRRYSDGLSTVMYFHEATGDPAYLQAIRDSAFFHRFDHGKGDGGGNSLTWEVQGALGYVLANGIVPEEKEEEFLKTAAERSQELLPTEAWGDSSSLDYDKLVEVVTEKLPPTRHPTYRESYPIGDRARWAFYALPWFGADSEFLPKETKQQP